MLFIGNKEILNLHKVGFLSSRRCPAHVVLKSFEWAKKQRKEGNCVVCGNHSQIEKDVFEILIKGQQPIILVLARSIKSRWGPVVEKAIDENRLLVISEFSNKTKRITRETAKDRNKTIIDLCDQLVVGYKSRDGQLDTLLVGRQFINLSEEE